MIKFFRKIRQRLLIENSSSGADRPSKFSKYLLYAIGEIVLVVFGILIALQINNWNENRIITEKETIHLENILRNLQDDLNHQLIPCIEKTENQILAYELLKINFYDKKSISKDSIRSLFFQNLSQWDLVLNTVAFDNLKSTGMDILSNDSIKYKLLTLYGNNYKYIERLQLESNKFHYDGVTTLLNDNTNFWDELSDEDEYFLKNDKRFTTRLRSEAYYSYAGFLRELNHIKPKAEELIENIEVEIIRLKKE